MKSRFQGYWFSEKPSQQKKLRMCLGVSNAHHFILFGKIAENLLSHDEPKNISYRAKNSTKPFVVNAYAKGGQRQLVHGHFRKSLNFKISGGSSPVTAQRF